MRNSAVRRAPLTARLAMALACLFLPALASAQTEGMQQAAATARAHVLAHEMARQSGRYHEALAGIGAAVQIYGQTAQDDELAEAILKYLGLYAELHFYDETRQATDAMEGLLTVTVGQQSLSFHLARLLQAEAMIRAGAFDEAAKALRAEQERREGRLTRRHAIDFGTASAGRLLRRGDHRKAAELLEAAAKDARTAFPKVPSLQLTAQRLLVEARREELGGMRQAETLIDGLVALSETLYRSDHPEVAVDLLHYGDFLENLDRHAEALAVRERAVGVLAGVHTPRHPLAVRARLGLASSLIAVGRAARAVALLRPLAFGKERIAAGVARFDAMTTLARAQISDSDPAVVETLAELMALQSQRFHETSSERFVEWRIQMALAHALANEDEKAVAILNDTLQTGQLSDRNLASLIRAHATLALVEQKRGRWPEALAAAREARLVAERERYVDRSFDLRLGETIAGLAWSLSH